MIFSYMCVMIYHRGRTDWNCNIHKRRTHAPNTTNSPM
nr:MAG TPA_asm: hypothetical protein [Caudoviricetes sp.]